MARVVVALLLCGVCQSAWAPGDKQGDKALQPEGLELTNSTASQSFISARAQSNPSFVPPSPSTFKDYADLIWTRAFWPADIINYLSAILYLVSFYKHAKGQPKWFMFLFYLGFAMDELVHLAAVMLNEYGNLFYEAVDLGVQMMARSALTIFCLIGMRSKDVNKYLIFGLSLFFFLDIVGHLSIFLICVVKNQTSYIHPENHVVNVVQFFYSGGIGQVFWQLVWWSTTLFLGFIYEYTHTEGSNEEGNGGSIFNLPEKAKSLQGYTATYLVVGSFLFVGMMANAVLNGSLVAESAMYLAGDESVCQA